MKLGLLGKGKTGSKVIELFPSAVVFDSNSKATVESLKQLDAVISFLPGPAFLQHIPLLLEAKTPTVVGSTGFEWPLDIQAKLVDQDLKWIYGHNFSLGMNLVFKMIKILGKAPALFEKLECSIHEIHHTQKLDSPSGTALKWKDWLGLEASISSEREGDVIGDHQLRLKTENEEITLQHKALDRKIFAEGAIWAATKLTTNPTIEAGLHRFEDISLKELL
ncbi:MAG: hypothetical protein HN509_07990 [Halobacteriovoraceae bacterium]|nr:hypothetical protein [Halobacteriovoraceae bacterium]MBT5094519.1 hypothetical protein [Halobacteriovoraceae bacterium]